MLLSPVKYIYTWCFIDHFTGILSPRQVYRRLLVEGEGYLTVSKVEALALLRERKQEVKTLFKIYGWEGDGELGLIWIPPFILSDDTWGDYIWHVKQQNNGVSFLGSSVPLRFPILLEQNKEEEE